jgi:serine/threonine protein kinase
MDACNGEEALALEVASLLKVEASGFLQRPAAEVAAAEMARTRLKSLVGRRFNHYQILSLIGAGGMAEVYRAHDTKLNRDVAMKLLPHDPSQQRVSGSRLLHEAQLLASLNHPHIASIYGIEEDEQFSALVLEFVDGETLSDKISRAPVRFKEALEIGRQILDALAAAHEKNIVHRDLKPANIKLTREGKVKLLDFGLAQGFTGSNLEHQPETSVGADAFTAHGLIPGTPGYLSPEQARGARVDQRSDIWSFGCVLFEMLTGQRAFERDTVPETVEAALNQDPDWNLIPAGTPLAVTGLLRRCLERDFKKRLQSVSAVQNMLDRGVL